MGRWVFSVLIVLFTASWGVCQGFAQPESPPSLATQFASAPVAPNAAVRTTSDDVAELRTSITQLQERLQQLSGATASPPPPAGTSFNTIQPSGDVVELRAFWKSGLMLKSNDDAFHMHVGGMLHYDHGFNTAQDAVQYGPGGIGNLQDGGLLRRARVRLEGTLYRNIDFLAEYDFANSVENDTSSGSPQTIGSPSINNAWIGVHQVPILGSIKVGWMNEPLGMENFMSSRFLPFMERMPANLLYNSPGILAHDVSADERGTWQLGIFHPQNNNYGFGYGDGQYAYTGRTTWLPWYACKGEQLIHLGLSASHRHLNEDEVRFRGRPSVRTMPSTVLPSLADTGNIGGINEDIFGVEFAGVWGSWSWQAEYFANYVHDAIYPNSAAGVPQGTLFYQSAYVEALYFLTGEHQPYNKTDGTFTRVEPHSNFTWGGPGLGAWQVGIRYAYIDLQNKGVNGATLHDITLGLNWFINSQTKVQWNLAIDHRDSTPAGSSGWSYIFGARLAIDF